MWYYKSKVKNWRDAGVLYIIICENNANYRNKTYDIINQYMMSTNIDYKITTYSSYNEKLQEFIDNPPDGHKIYFLDIELDDDTSGIDIATDIRETDFDSQIIMVSGYETLLSNATKLRLSLLDYIHKTMQYDKNIKELIELCLKIFNLRKSIKFKIEKNDYNIKYDDVLMIETDSIVRKCTIYTKTKEYIVKKPLKFFEEQMDSNFYKINRGCIENLSNISKIDYKKNVIKLNNNKIIKGMIALSNMKGLKERVGNY